MGKVRKFAGISVSDKFASQDESEKCAENENHMEMVSLMQIVKL